MAKLKCIQCQRGSKTLSKTNSVCASCQKKNKKEYIANFIETFGDIDDLEAMAEHFYDLERRLKKIENNLEQIVFRG